VLPPFYYEIKRNLHHSIIYITLTIIDVSISDEKVKDVILWWYRIN